MGGYTWNSRWFHLRSGNRSCYCGCGLDAAPENKLDRPSNCTLTDFDHATRQLMMKEVPLRRMVPAYNYSLMQPKTTVLYTTFTRHESAKCRYWRSYAHVDVPSRHWASNCGHHGADEVLSSRCGETVFIRGHLGYYEIRGAHWSQ